MDSRKYMWVLVGGLLCVTLGLAASQRRPNQAATTDQQVAAPSPAQTSKVVLPAAQGARMVAPIDRPVASAAGAIARVTAEERSVLEPMLMTIDGQVGGPGGRAIPCPGGVCPLSTFDGATACLNQNCDKTDNHSQIACGIAGDGTTQNGYARCFDFVIEGVGGAQPFVVDSVKWGIEQLDSPSGDIVQVDVNIYADVGCPPVFGRAVLLAVVTEWVTVGDAGTIRVTPIPGGVTIPAGWTMVVELFAPADGTLGIPGNDHSFRPLATQDACVDAYIRAMDCGFVNWTPFSGIGFPDSQTLLSVSGHVPGGPVVSCGDGVVNGCEQCDPPDGGMCDDNCQLGGKCAPPGDDCWATDCDGATKFDFSGTPIPANFFYGGSPSFAGVVELGGAGGPLADTFIQRLDTMCFSAVPSVATTDVEMVQLSLVSCVPLDVGGQQFNMFVGLAGPQPLGTLTATKAHDNGGTYTATIPVNAEFTFQSVAGGPILGPIAAPPITLQTSPSGSWLQTDPGTLCGAEGFFAGWGTDLNSGQPCCQPTCHPDPAGGHDHCVYPPDCPKCPGVCCDKGGACVDTMTETMCMAADGLWNPNASCGDPNFVCNVGCFWDNGPPSDDIGSTFPVAQLDLNSIPPWVAATADDFYLNDQGPNQCQIDDIITWVGHFGGGAAASSPADYDGVHVTVYANIDPKGPAGQPEADGTHTEYVLGGVVFTQFVINFAWVPVGLPCFNNDPNFGGPTFELQIPVSGLFLEKKTKYWLEIIPQVSFTDLDYQTVLMFSQVNHMHESQDGFPSLGTPFWAGQPANADICPPSTPLAGSLRGVAFVLQGQKVPTCTKGAPPGDDCWKTECGNGTAVEFGSPDIPPIPAGFFGDSLEYSGPVELGGQSLGWIDTTISRLEDMCFDGTPPVTDSTAIEIVQLDLIACQPLTINFDDGLGNLWTEAWDMRVYLDGPQPQGMLTATKENQLGGTFDSDIQVRPAFEFIGPNGPPGLILTLPLGDTLTLSSTGLPWVQDMPPTGSPCGGIGFFPGHSKDDPDCCPWSCHAGPSSGHDHCVAPPKCPKCPPPCVDKPAPAGDDCWKTECGNGTAVDFGSPDIPAIPADFFGQYSQAYTGAVELGGQSGFIDTIISRLGDMCFDGTPPVTDSTPIVILQLDLVACLPLTINFDDGLGNLWTEAWDLRVYLDGPQPQGMLTATKENQVGGTFDSDIQVIPGFEFTGPAGQQALLTPGIVLTLASTGLPWIQYAPPGGTPCGTGGGFYPGYSKDDETCCPPSCHAGPSPGHDHCVQPPKCPACDENWEWKDYNGDEAGGYLPDFDQNKDYDGDGSIKRERFYCGPTAVANSIWWFDQKFPDEGVIPAGWTKWDLIEDLAHRMATQGCGNPLDPNYWPSPNNHPVPYCGTYVDDMQSGIDDYLNDYGLTGLLYEHTEQDPDFLYIASEVQRSQDVTLLVGFWHIEEVTYDAANGEYLVRWRRTGGHFITVAGVNKSTISIAVSDPDADAAEQGAPGVVRGGDHDHDGDGNPGTIPGFRDPGYDHTKHNKKIFASHDYYDLRPSFSPGGQLNLLSMGNPLLYGATMAQFHECDSPIVDDSGVEVDCDFDGWLTTVTDDFLSLWNYPPPTPCQTYTEIEYAVVVSPFECEKTIIVEIMTDGWPSETTWEIVDKNSGGVVASGGPYTDPNTLHSHAVCADPAGCYNFTIFDSFGDGLCCAFGNGYYNVYFQGGLVGSGAVFGFSETVRNIGWDCRIDDCFPSNLLIDVEVDGIGREIIALSSAGHPPAIVERDPPPYTTGGDIGAEMISLELSGVSTMLGPILLRESPTQASTGAIVNVSADGSGGFLSGDSYFDVFAEIELANMPMFGTVKTKDPHRVVACGITSLPPVGATYHWSGYCKGDLDENGVLDGRDIRFFIDCILGVAPPLPCCQLADMDKDGDLDMDDVIAFVNNLLNKVCVPNPIPLHATIQPNVTCLVQPPNQVNAIYSDVAMMQFVAENFVLSGYGWIDSLKFYGGYDGAAAPPDDFKITFYTDAGGLPGQIINQRTPQVSRTATGLVYPWGANQYEYTVVFDPNKELLPGTYWIEISNDTTPTPGTAWYWEEGSLDTVKGIPGIAYSLTNPKPRDPWGSIPSVDVALEIICKDQGPQKIEIGRIWSIDHVVKDSKPGACCLPPAPGRCGVVPAECIITTEEDCVCRGGNFLGQNVPCTQVIRIVNHQGPPSGWSHQFVTVSNCDPANRGASCVSGPYHVDPWTTAESGSSNCENFDPTQNPQACPIPADFFGPGSDPFTGEICFEGVPLGMVQLPGFPDPLDFGEADTLVKRPDDPFDRCDLPPSVDDVTVGIEIVELNLMACEPIIVDFADGTTEQWEVEVEVDPSQQPQTSTLTASKTHCNGGTFYSSLDVCPRFVFTNVLHPTRVQVLDYCNDCNPAGMQMDTSNVPWVHDPDPDLGLVSPVCSDFHPGLEETDPTVDCDCNNNGVRDKCDIDPTDPDGNGEVSPDCNDNGIPDECDPDCDGDGIPDDCDSDPCVGACCDDSTGACNDGVPPADCPPPLRYEPGALCADLVPPCAGGVGACCLDPQTCLDGVPESDCVDILGGTYMGDGVLCEPLLCEAVGACCLAAMPCLDGLPEPDCQSQGGIFLGADVLCYPDACPCDPVDPACPADLNCDGVVDDVDAAILLYYFGFPCPQPCPPLPCPGDLNGDCVVNALDIALLLAAYGPC